MDSACGARVSGTAEELFAVLLLLFLHFFLGVRFPLGCGIELSCAYFTVRCIVIAFLRNGCQIR